jgi:hypothetical protein
MVDFSTRCSATQLPVNSNVPALDFIKAAGVRSVNDVYYVVVVMVMN